jgi:hypothetical protein
MEGFSEHIFWDVDRGSVELPQNSVWLTQRVLEKGFWSDWKYLLDQIGKDKIIESVKQMRSLENKALHFVCSVLEIDKNQLRCYKNKHSLSTHWSY